MNTFFVAGATGYTGRNLVHLSTGRDDRRVRAHIRPGSSSLERLRTEFEAAGAAVDTTPWDEAAMTHSLREHAPAAVFALLGTTKKHTRAAAARGEDAGYEAVDYGLTALLIRAAVASGVRPRFVYLSTMGLGSSEPRGAYMRVRWRIERELAASGLPYTVVRPSFISGPDRGESRPGERVGAAVADGALALVGAFGGKRTRDRYRSITGSALAAALARLALDPGAEDRIVEADELR